MARSDYGMRGLHLRQRAGFTFLVSTVALTLVYATWESLLELSMLDSARLVIGVGALLWSLAYHTAVRRFYSPSIVYLTVFSLFHLGLVFVTATGIPLRSDEEFRYLGTWYFDSALTTEAILVAGLGQTALVWGTATAYLVASRRPRAVSTLRRSEVPTLAEAMHHKLQVIGSLILAAASISWFGVALASGGPRLLVGSYGGWLEATRGVAVWWIYLLMGIGLCVVAATAQSGRGRSLLLGFVPFIAFVVFGLPIGLRGEILFPLAGAVSVYGVRRTPPRLTTVVLLILVSLMGIATLRAIRSGGLGAISTDALTMSPTEGLVELGSSLRPTWEVIRWRDAGEPYLGGTSYIAPFDRVASRFIPGVTRLPAEQDQRLMNVAIVDRTGSALGFSPVAEAHRNFGTLGVFVVMALIGHFLGWLDHLTGLRGQLFLGVLLVPLLINVRNSFTSLPAQITVGMLMVSALLAWARLSDFRPLRDYAPQRSA